MHHPYVPQPSDMLSHVGHVVGQLVWEAWVCHRAFFFSVPTQNWQHLEIFGEWVEIAGANEIDISSLQKFKETHRVFAFLSVR